MLIPSNGMILCWLYLFKGKIIVSTSYVSKRFRTFTGHVVCLISYRPFLVDEDGPVNQNVIEEEEVSLDKLSPLGAFVEDSLPYQDATLL